MEKASGTPLEMQHHLYPRVQQLCKVGQRAMGHMAPWWQQELEEGTAEPPSAWTTLVVGVVSVPFSAVLALCYPCSVLSGSGHRYLCCCLREPPASQCMGLAQAELSWGHTATKRGSSRIWKG